MKRDSGDNLLINHPLSTSSYTFYCLLSASDILIILKSIRNESLFVDTVSEVFKQSFIVVDKFMYNRSVLNTLNNIGLVNELGLCLIHRLVIIKNSIIISCFIIVINILIYSFPSRTKIWIQSLQNTTAMHITKLWTRFSILRKSLSS